MEACEWTNDLAGDFPLATRKETSLNATENNCIVGIYHKISKLWL